MAVSVLGTVLGPIHTTLLGLFHPRIPQTLWNSGKIDRRKLEACLEFTTISTDRGAAFLLIEEQAHTNSSGTFFPGSAVLFRVKFSSG